MAKSKSKVSQSVLLSNYQNLIAEIAQSHLLSVEIKESESKIRKLKSVKSICNKCSKFNSATLQCRELNKRVSTENICIKFTKGRN